MRVLVCGSRGWTDRQAVEDALCALLPSQGEKTTVVLIHGAARGADQVAADVARSLNTTMREADFAIHAFPADWKKYGRYAGFVRNQQMLDEGKPDLVLAFWDGKSRGTADMINRTRRAGVPVRIISPTSAQ